MNELTKQKTVQNNRKRINQNLRKFVILFILITIWAILAAITPNHVFIHPKNLSNLFTQVSGVAIIAVGMVLIIVSGQIDLSVGSIVGICVAVSAIMQAKLGIGTVWAILVPIVIGAAACTWNGYWSAYQGVPPFIVTLASMLIFRGLVLVLTKGESIASMNESFRFIAHGSIPKNWGVILAGIGLVVFILLELRKRKEKILKGIKVSSLAFELIKIIAIVLVVTLFVAIMNSYKGIQFPVVIVIIVTIIVSIISKKTRFGRHLYAIGGNIEAAKLSGINVKLEVLKAYILLGVLSAISALVLLSRLDASTPSAGVNIEFDAISAVIIGGTSFLGGSGTVLGAIVGSLIMGSINNGMSLMNMPAASQYILKGGVLLLAVWFDIKGRSKEG